MPSFELSELYGVGNETVSRTDGGIDNTFDGVISPWKTDVWYFRDSKIEENE